MCYIKSHETLRSKLFHSNPSSTTLVVFNQNFDLPVWANGYYDFLKLLMTRAEPGLLYSKFPCYRKTASSFTHKNERHIYLILLALTYALEKGDCLSRSKLTENALQT